MRETTLIYFGENAENVLPAATLQKDEEHDGVGGRRQHSIRRGRNDALRSDDGCEYGRRSQMEAGFLFMPTTLNSLSSTKCQHIDVQLACNLDLHIDQRNRSIIYN